MNKQEIVMSSIYATCSMLLGFGFAALLDNTSNLYLAFGFGALVLFLIGTCATVVGANLVINSLIESLVKESVDQNKKK